LSRVRAQKSMEHGEHVLISVEEAPRIVCHDDQIHIAAGGLCSSGEGPK